MSLVDLERSAREHEGSGRHAAAARLWRKIVERAPSWNNWVALASVYLESGQLEMALAAAQSAIDVEPAKAVLTSVLARFANARATLLRRLTRFGQGSLARTRWRFALSWPTYTAAQGSVTWKWSCWRLSSRTARRTMKPSSTSQLRFGEAIRRERLQFSGLCRITAIVVSGA